MDELVGRSGCDRCGRGGLAWSENGYLYELRSDGSRGRRIADRVTSIWTKWMTDRFGAMLMCRVCGALGEPVRAVS